jgi:hypothetical protein
VVFAGAAWSSGRAKGDGGLCHHKLPLIPSQFPCALCPTILCVRQVHMLALTYITYAGIYFARKNFAVVKHTLTQDSSVSFTSGGINGVETAFLFA